MPLCIGLTGGIGSGKSTTAALFGVLGAEVIDTDEIAHQLCRPAGDAVAAIANEFGREYINAEGALDRPRMRQLVFTDPGARKRLEHILHPLIGSAVRARIAHSTAPYALIVVPLLLETGAYQDLLARVVVVDCPEELQISRTMQRSKLDEREVRAIMAAQHTRTQRLARADDVIMNDGDRAQLDLDVTRLHQKYLTLARQQ